jgi:hypothetical protein
MLFFLFACSDLTLVDSADTLALDSGLNSNQSFSLVYDGETLPNQSTLSLTTAPAGLKNTHTFTFQAVNHSSATISVNCSPDWENSYLSLGRCPENIEPFNSAALDILFSPETHPQGIVLDIPILFLEHEYEMRLQLTVPDPLVTLFWGDNGYLLRSTDYGTSVTEYHQENEQSARSITWGAGLFLKTSSSTEDLFSPGVYEVSTDGILWAEVQGTQDIAPSGCAYGKNKFVCARDDAISWITEEHIYHEQSMGALKHHDIVFANETFLAVGRNGRRSISIDGQTWSQETTHGLGDDYSQVIHSGTHFIAVGGKDRFLISWSTDAINWQDRMFPPTLGAKVETVIVDNTRTIISGTGINGENILYSHDFQIWDPLRQDDPDLQMLILNYLNQRYLGLGTKEGQTALYHSENGMNWTLVHNIPTGIQIAGLATEGWSE